MSNLTCAFVFIKNLRIILDKNKKNTRWGSAPFGHATRLCHALCEPARNAPQIRLAASTMPPNPNGQKQQKHILALYSNTEISLLSRANCSRRESPRHAPQRRTGNRSRRGSPRRALATGNYIFIFEHRKHRKHRRLCYNYRLHKLHEFHLLHTSCFNHE